MKQFAIWEVGEESYKLKLKASATIELEEKLGCSLLNILMSGTMPSLRDMLLITHSAIKGYNSNIKFEDAKNMFDSYVDEGGDQTTFFTKVVMEVFKVSGFFPREKVEEMEKQLEEV